MISSNNVKKQRKNPNDPARFVANIAVIPDGEKADIKYLLDTSRISDESQYDGLYAICTDLLHEKCGFRTDYEFITKRKMKNIQKASKLR